MLQLWLLQFSDWVESLRKESECLFDITTQRSQNANNFHLPLQVDNVLYGVAPAIKWDCSSAVQYLGILDFYNVVAKGTPRGRDGKKLGIDNKIVETDCCWLMS